MEIKIKNWDTFQHYSNRRPPWIKLYRELLDDPEFHELEGDLFKYLVMMWLIASEDRDRSGKLPPKKALCFRLRVNEAKLDKIINGLSHWLDICYQDASNMLADGLQDAIPETETETETEKRQKRDRINSYKNMFIDFYHVYPNKVKKKDAKKAWDKLASNGNFPGIDVIVSALKSQIEYKKYLNENNKFCPDWPHPASWINGARWEDEIHPGDLSRPVQVDPEYEKAMGEFKYDTGKPREG